MLIEHRKFTVTEQGELGRKWYREYDWRDGGRGVASDMEDLITPVFVSHPQSF